MREAASFIARQNATAEPGFLSALVDTLQHAVHAWSNRRKVVTLAEFDDHMLADIGLSRGDVRQALAMPFSEDPSLELQRLARRRAPRGWQA